MLADLAEDPAKLEEFRNDPNAVMDEYQLTEEQKQLLTSGNQGDFIRAIMDEHNQKFGPFGGRLGCI
ncbi:hypothetical protein NG796_02135 [Laspinema sp. A4]|nr:hypothetical protein [Laspinema sp. D2d]